MSQKNFLIVLFGLIVAVFVVSFFMTRTPEANDMKQASSTDEMVSVEFQENQEPVNENEPSNSGVKPQGKIDVKFVCESSLMYTTFTDGAAADAYVAECIEGKHPDVIERYIESLELDDSVAI